MSGRMIRKRVCPASTAARQCGIGMLEFLFALLVFSIGMTGFLSAQLAGKKVGHEASQRSVATALARDILERIRTNPGQLNAYQVEDVGDTEALLSLPSTDCEASFCTTAQLAQFDLWQWESSLLGVSELQNDAVSGGIISPRACITNDAGLVTVTISWLGPAMGDMSIAETSCGGTATEAGSLEDSVEGKTRQRNQLSITTYIAAR